MDISIFHEINLTIQRLKCWGTPIYGTPHGWRAPHGALALQHEIPPLAPRHTWMMFNGDLMGMSPTTMVLKNIGFHQQQW